MLLILYRALTFILHPFVILYLMKRRLRGKEHPERWHERLGHAGFPRPEGGVVWLHAASVGEAQSITPLIKILSDAYPQASILLTTGTVTSAQLMDAKLPDRAYHQFVPVDTWLSVRRFLNHWKPDIAIWTESELWPNLITMTHARTVPMALLNARMSLGSYHVWQRFPKTIRAILRCFDVVFPQSSDDAERLTQLGARGVHMLGNLKHDSPPLAADSKEMGALINQIGGRAVWVAASTHAGEESLIAQAHRTLAEDHPDLLTIIAPRHPDRGEKIANLLAGEGFQVALRSRQEPIAETTAIYVADTLGELGIFYRIAEIVFMGGSLVPHGGQNPLEPARLDCALITGPHTHNFVAICAELEAKQALIRVQDVRELTVRVSELLRDHAKQEGYAKTALKLAEDKQGVLESVRDRLTPLLETALSRYAPAKKKSAASTRGAA